MTDVPNSPVEAWVDAIREWTKRSVTTISDARGRFSSLDPPTLLVFALAVVLFAAFSRHLAVQYWSFRLPGGDFGDYVHMFASTVHGTAFLGQGKYRAGVTSYWGGHFAVTLLLLLPIYAVIQSPLTLLLAKSFLLAASVPMLWFVARGQLDDDRLAGLLVASYAFNPFLWSAWTVGFQEQSFLPLFVFAAYYAYLKGRRVAFLVLFTLVLLTNEFALLMMGGFLVGLGIAAGRTGRLNDERTLFVVAIVLVVGLKLVSGAVVGTFNQFPGIPIESIAAPVQPFVSGPRATTGGLVAILASHPSLIITSFGVQLPLKAAFLLFVLAPVLFLTLTDEAAVLALAPFLAFAWLLAGKSGYFTFNGHYPLYILPFVYVGAVRALDRFDPPSPSLQAFAVCLVVLAVVTTAVGGAGALRVQPAPGQTEHTAVLQDAVDTVPPDASVITSNLVYPHFAMRPNARYVAAPSQFHRYERMNGRISPTYVVYDQTKPEWATKLKQAFGSRLTTEYGLYRYQDGVAVYRRGYHGPPKDFAGNRFVPARFGAKRFQLANARLTDGVIRARSTPTSSGPLMLWYGPYTSLPPGTYTATFHVRVRSPQNRSNSRARTRPALTLDVAAGGNHRSVAQRTIGQTHGWRNVKLTFTLDEPTSDVEFRGSWARKRSAGRVAFSSVSIERAARSNRGPNGTNNSTDVMTTFRTVHR